MYKRVLARRLAVQALYQWQMTFVDVDQLLKEFGSDRDLGKADEAYFKELVVGVSEQFSELKSFLEGVLNCADQ